MLFAPDTERLNPGLRELRAHFMARYDPYFEADGRPKPEYFEETRCYNCGSASVTREFVIARFRHVRCAQCGMVYVSPRLREHLLHDTYADDEYADFFKIKLIPALPYRKTVINPRKYEQLMQYFTAPGRLLDVGCGLGDFLAECQSHGWDCLGIEFAPFAANYARQEFGLKIVGESIFDFEAAEGQFDCISLWGVLEHFTKPQAVLEKLHSLLHPSRGVLLLEVPSGDSLLVRYFERYGGYVDRIIEGDRHNMLFSVRGLREMTARAGFVESKLVSNGLDIDTLARLSGTEIPKSEIARWQAVVDDALEGDLLRGFFRPR